MVGRVWASKANLHLKLESVSVKLPGISPPQSLFWPATYLRIPAGYTTFIQVIIEINLGLFGDWQLDYVVLSSHVCLPGFWMAI